MLLLTYLWNASPSVCEETRQDLPPQLRPRCAGFAVHPETHSTAARSPSAPGGGPHSILHTSPAPGVQALGPEETMNQTRSLPTESSQSAGGGNTHINYAGPRWQRTSAQRRGEREAGWPGEGKGVFLNQSQGQERSQRWGPEGPSSCFCSPVTRLLGRALSSPSLPHAGLRVSAPLSFSSCSPHLIPRLMGCMLPPRSLPPMSINSFFFLSV